MTGPFEEYFMKQRAGYALCLDSSETDNFFRPLALLFANTLRPLAVDMRSLNPCLFFLFRFDG